MRILHVANFNNNKYGVDIYNMDRKISSGLIQNGHFVYNFSYRDVCRNESVFRTTKLGTGKLNQKLLKACDNIHPDLLLLGHSELVEAATLEEIKIRHPDAKIALWYVDALFHERKMAHVFERLPVIDIFFATTGGEYLKKYAGKNSRAAFFPNIVDKAVESYTSFSNRDHDNDLIFCGRDSNNSERQQFMHSLNENGGSFMRCSFRGCLGYPPITGWHYLDFLSRSRMGLNLSRRDDVELYSSDRLVQLIGNGLLTFCPKVPKMEILYGENDLIYFDTLDDLLDKLMYYQQHQEEGRRIAENGWRTAHKSHNAKRVTGYMLELLFELPFSSEYEWQEAIYPKL
jgi:hypothetical protein